MRRGRLIVMSGEGGGGQFGPPTGSGIFDGRTDQPGGCRMIVSMILDYKGREVVTIAPTATVGEAVAELSRHKIGALVVVEGRDRIVGIISERDIVRAVARGIATYLSEPVTSIMTRDVMTCGERETINE